MTSKYLAYGWVALILLGKFIETISYSDELSLLLFVSALGFVAFYRNELWLIFKNAMAELLFNSDLNTIESRPLGGRTSENQMPDLPSESSINSPANQDNDANAATNTGTPGKTSLSGRIDGAAKVLWSTGMFPWDAIAVFVLRIPVAAAVEASLNSTTIGVPLSRLMLIYVGIRVIVHLSGYKKGLLILRSGSISLVTPNLELLADFDDPDDAGKNRVRQKDSNTRIIFTRGLITMGGFVELPGSTLPNERPKDLIRKAKLARVPGA